MREISLTAATAVITASITAWSMHTVGTGTPANTTAASTSMNIMQMMRMPKTFPSKSYDRATSRHEGAPPRSPRGGSRSARRPTRAPR